MDFIESLIEKFGSGNVQVKTVGPDGRIPSDDLGMKVTCAKPKERIIVVKSSSGEGITPIPEQH